LRRTPGEKQAMLEVIADGLRSLLRIITLDRRGRSAAKRVGSRNESNTLT
jgi:hypothetical protein